MLGSAGAGPAVVAPDVHGDAAQPVDERFLRRPVGQVAVGPDKRFLHQILQLGVTRRKAMQEAGDHALMPTHQIRERVGLALLRAGNQEIVVGLSSHPG